VGHEPLLSRQRQHVRKLFPKRDDGQAVLQRLLHGRHRNFFEPVQLQHPPLRMPSDEKRQLVDAQFYCLFDEPLHPVQVFGRCHGQVNPVRTGGVGLLVHHPKRCPPRIGDFQHARVAVARPVGHFDGVALLQPQRFCAVPRFVLPQKPSGAGVRLIKQGH